MSGDVRDPSAWMSFADEDLQAARILSEQEDAHRLAHIIAFHAHQSAEKYLKGLLAKHQGVEPPHIHNLRKLLSEVFRYAPEFETPALEDASNGLDQFYIPSRYPAEVGGPSGPIQAEEAAEALSWAEEIAAVVRPRLES